MQQPYAAPAAIGGWPRSEFHSDVLVGCVRLFARGFGDPAAASTSQAVSVQEAKRWQPL